MKFRDEDNLEAFVRKSRYPDDLVRTVNRMGTEYDIVDLQYSTSTINSFLCESEIEYSVFILARRKKD